MSPLDDLISAARGEIEVDLLLEGAEFVNVISGERLRQDVAIHDGRVVGFDCYSAKKTLDLDGLVLLPGFVDGHFHIESAMVTVPEYARAVVPRGTTTIIIDPHEIANVLGKSGIQYMLDSSKDLPINVFIMLPSCVPATDLETSGARLDAKELSEFIDHERVLGIGEMMNYPGVIYRDPSVLDKIKLVGRKRIDGHAPGLSGRDLAAYVAAGIKSDHECTALEEAREKLRLGMHIMIREGSAAKNLHNLLPLVTPENSRNCSFVTDDRHPSDILKEGHIDFMIKTSIEEGLDPILAVQMATINGAQYFGLENIGAIAPGYMADIVVIDDLAEMNVLQVIKDGKVVADIGTLTAEMNSPPMPPISKTVNNGHIDVRSFDIPAKSEWARVIGVIPDQIITQSLNHRVVIKDGFVIPDTDQDILKMAVIERHNATGNIGLGLVSGFGLEKGAIATSVTHDSHNIAVVGAVEKDMLAAASAIKSMSGGLVVVDEGETKAKLPLPIAGLISKEQMWEVADGIEKVVCAARKLGCQLNDPFMTLSFLCLPVIPELKLTDKGLVDVAKFEHVPLFTEDS
jgi:adenine deaminase